MVRAVQLRRFFVLVRVREEVAIERALMHAAVQRDLALGGARDVQYARCAMSSLVAGPSFEKMTPGVALRRRRNLPLAKHLSQRQGDSLQSLLEHWGPHRSHLLAAGHIARVRHQQSHPRMVP